MSESYATILVAGVGMFATWAVWVTVMIFELKTKIMLLKQEIKLLTELKEVLRDIRERMFNPVHIGPVS